MKLRTVYKLHRWIAIFFGVILLNQLISGAVMVLPLPDPTEPERHPPIDYQSITLSPAGALEALAQASPEEVQDRLVRAVTLRQLLGRLLYEVKLHGGGTHLIDAESGEMVEITPELAARIARSTLGTSATARQVERLEHYDYRWRHGALPVYRVTLEDSEVSVVYVSVDSGEVGGRSDRWGRIRGLIGGGLHEFQPVGWLLGSNRARKALLLLLSLVGVATALTGYYLALPRRWTK